MATHQTFQQEVDLVFDLLTDPDFLVDRCIALGNLSAEGQAETDGDKVTTHLVREVENDLPAFVAKILKPVQTINVTERWRPKGSGWEGEMTVKVVGQPITISAMFSLEPNNDGCIYITAARAKADIPLIGRKIEKFLVKQFESDAARELGYTQEYLGVSA